MVTSYSHIKSEFLLILMKTISGFEYNLCYIFIAFPQQIIIF